jgi:hypothetical protein
MAARMIERARTRISPGTPVVVTWLGAAAAATALSVAACTSSQREVDTRFVAKANAICAQAVARHSGHRFPLPGFDPLHPRPADLPAVGRYFARYGGASATTARMYALAAPTTHQREWQELRALINQAAANARRQITVANAPTSPDSSRPCAPRGTCRRRSTESPPGSGSRLHRRAVNSSAELPLAAYRPPISTKEHVDR